MPLIRANAMTVAMRLGGGMCEGSPHRIDPTRTNGNTLLYEGIYASSQFQ